MTRPRGWEKVFFMFAPLLFGLLFITLPCQKGSTRVRMRLDDNWPFHKTTARKPLRLHRGGIASFVNRETLWYNTLGKQRLSKRRARD